MREETEILKAMDLLSTIETTTTPQIRTPIMETKTMSDHRETTATATVLRTTKNILRK